MPGPQVEARDYGVARYGMEAQMPEVLAHHISHQGWMLRMFVTMMMILLHVHFDDAGDVDNAAAADDDGDHHHDHSDDDLYVFVMLRKMSMMMVMLMMMMMMTILMTILMVMVVVMMNLMFIHVYTLILL